MNKYYKNFGGLSYRNGNKENIQKNVLSESEDQNSGYNFNNKKTLVSYLPNHQSKNKKSKKDLTITFQKEKSEMTL